MSEDQWLVGKVDPEKIDKEYPAYPGQVMFPSRHDIVPDNLTASLSVLEKLFKAGNRVLVVTKPNFSCIETLCRHFRTFRQQLLFRFTITADNEQVLKFWEPNAPSYRERKKSLQYAFSLGFQTSVSVEPILDIEHVVTMVKDLEPFVTHSIWLGKMNKVQKRVVVDSEEVKREIDRIQAEQCDRRIRMLYEQLKNRPLVRWKESIKRVVGLPLAERPGLDI